MSYLVFKVKFFWVIIKNCVLEDKFGMNLNFLGLIFESNYFVFSLVRILLIMSWIFESNRTSRVRFGSVQISNKSKHPLTFYSDILTGNLMLKLLFLFSRTAYHKFIVFVFCCRHNNIVWKGQQILMISSDISLNIFLSAHEIVYMSKCVIKYATFFRFEQSVKRVDVFISTILDLSETWSIILFCFFWKTLFRVAFFAEKCYTIYISSKNKILIPGNFQ